MHVSSNNQVLVASEASEQLEALARAVGAGHLLVERAQGGAEALRRAPACQVAVIDGPLVHSDLLGHLAATAPGGFLPVLAIARGADPEQLLGAGADVCLPPDAPPGELQAQLDALLRLRARHDALLARQRELEELSRTDALTGLLNRRTLEERIAEEFRRAQRHGDALSLLMLDLDWFKQINDQRGQPFGDKVLREVAKTLQAQIRETDLCARYGGEEFSVVLPRTSLNGALTVGERIRTAIAQGGYEGERLTVSVGIAGLPGAGSTSPELLLRAADEALYLAKREGRNRTRLYRNGPRRAAQSA